VVFSKGGKGKEDSFMNGILRIRRVLFAFLIVFMTVLFSACGGGGNGSDNPSGGALTTGNWSGSGVSFTLIEGSYWISDLSVTYSGSATGTICSFNYTKTETMGTDILVELDAVTNNWIFSYDSPDSPFLDLADLTIEGVDVV
jgi:hypothetical protein